MVDTFLGVLWAMLVFALINGYIIQDDTDGKSRSGLVVYTDHKTGIQYLGAPLGGLTVRVDENGKPMKGGE